MIGFMQHFASGPLMSFNRSNACQSNFSAVSGFLIIPALLFDDGGSFAKKKQPTNFYTSGHPLKLLYGRAREDRKQLSQDAELSGTSVLPLLFSLHDHLF